MARALFSAPFARRSAGRIAATAVLLGGVALAVVGAGSGEAAPQGGVPGATAAQPKSAPAGQGGKLSAGAVADGGAAGDGAAVAEGAGEGAPAAIDVNPTDITADSLISRHQDAPRDPHRGPVTNLPLPRYVSLKGGEGNARRGPSLSHRIDWVFRHPGMPLRVVAEFGHWRRVEDQDGAGGWVHYSLLSGVRTAIITTDMAELRARPDTNGTVIARAEAGAIVRLHECNRDWCRVSGGGEKGWVIKTSLWGVDAAETRD